MYYKVPIANGKLDIDYATLIEGITISNTEAFVKVRPDTLKRSNWTTIAEDEFNAKGVPALDYSKQKKIAELKRQCEAAITGGYQSTVVLASTGEAHVYPTDRDDQLNMSGTANAAQLKPAGTLIEFKTKDTGKYELHTQDEIKAISLEVYDHILANLKKMNEKAAQVMACNTVEEVQTIEW